MDSEQKHKGRPVRDDAGVSTWNFKSDDTTGSADDQPTGTSITWTASEFVAHKKGVLWFAGLLAGMAVFGGIGYWATHDFIPVLAVVVAAVLLGAAAVSRPQVLEYRLDSKGISMGKRFYAYSQFKSFSIINEGAFSSVALMPLGRFMPVLSIYYSPEDQQKILDILSQHLPVSEARHDFFDHILRSIRL